MKKIIYLCMLMCMVACGNNGNKYHITGMVEGGVEGDSVVLSAAIDDSILEKTTIKNGKFNFEGTIDTAKLYFAMIPARNMQLGFILEPGNIELNITQEVGNNWAKGTKNNTKMSANNKELLPKLVYMSSLFGSLVSDDLNEDGELEILTKLENEINSYNSRISKLLEDNKNTIIEDVIKFQLPEKLEMPEESVLAEIKRHREKAQTVAVGTDFADFELKTNTGKTVKLSDIAGKDKYVLIDFWASWCGPCRIEMPELVQLYDKYKAKGFEIVGVSVDESHDKWKDAITQMNMTWVQLIEQDNAAAGLYGVTGIPHTVLIDKNGKIMANKLRGKELKAKLEEIFEN